MDCHSHHFDDQCLRSTANTPPWSVRLSVISMSLYCCLNFWLPRIVPRFHFEKYWQQTNLIHYDELWEDLFHPSSSYIERAHAETASGSNNHIPPPYVALVKSSEELSSNCGENAAKFVVIRGANVHSQELFDSPCAKSVLQWYATDVEQPLSRLSYRTTKSSSANHKRIPTSASIQSRIEVLHLGVRKSFALSLPSILQRVEQDFNFTEIRTDISQRIYPVLCYHDDHASFTDSHDVRNQCRVVYSDVVELCDLCTLMGTPSGDAYVTRLLRSQFALFIPGPESYPSHTSASTEVATLSRICSQLISYWMEAALLGSIPVIPYSASANDSLAHRCANLGHPFFSVYSEARHGLVGNFTDDGLSHIPHVSTSDLMGYVEHFSSAGDTSQRLSTIAAQFYSSRSGGSAFIPSQQWDISHLFVAPHLARVIPWAAIQAHLPRQPDKIQAFHTLLDVLRPYLQTQNPSKARHIQAICQLQDSHEIMATNRAVQQLHERLTYRGRYSPLARTKATPKAAAPNVGSTPPSTTTSMTTTATSTSGSRPTARSRSSSSPIATVALQRPLRPHRSLLKTADHTTAYVNQTSSIASSLSSGSSLEIVLPRCCETFEGDLMWLDKVMSAVLASSPTKASPSTDAHRPTFHVSLYYKCPHCLPRRYARTWQETIVGPTIEKLRCPSHPSQPHACFNETTNGYSQDDAYQQILHQRGILLIDDGVMRLQSHVAKDPEATPLVTESIGDGQYVTTVGRLRLHEIPAFDWQSNGKEATAYLQHLRDRHATLATYTFFLHTQPAHHLQFGRFLRLLLYLHMCAIPPSSATARPGVATSWPVPAIDFIPLNYRWFAGVWAHLPERCALAVLHYLFRSSTASQYYIAGDEVRALPGINDIRTFLQQVPMASGVAAQFVVSRTTLQQRPASFYGRLYDLLTHELTTVVNTSIATTDADQNREREVFRHCRKRSYAVGTEVASAYERLWPHFFRAVDVTPRGENNGSSSSGNTLSSTHIDPLNHKFKAGSAEERAFSSPLALPDFPQCCRAQLPKFVWHDPTEGVV